MSRKHYRAFAEIVAGQRKIARLATAGCRAAEGWAVLEATRDMAVDMADVFLADNGSFQREKFYAACGIADVYTATGEAA